MSDMGLRTAAYLDTYDTFLLKFCVQLALCCTQTDEIELTDKTPKEDLEDLLKAGDRGSVCKHFIPA